MCILIHRYPLPDLCHCFNTFSINRYVKLSLGRLVAPPPDLSTCLSVTVDGKPLNLPSIQALLVINLPSYMKGTDPWGDVAQAVRRGKNLLLLFTVKGLLKLTCAISALETAKV